jgi:hypothetical protein
MKRVAKQVIPRTIRTMLRQVRDLMEDETAMHYRLSLATADQPKLRDLSLLLERMHKQQQLIEAIVGETTGRDGDEQYTLLFAAAT